MIQLDDNPANDVDEGPTPAVAELRARGRRTISRPTLSAEELRVAALLVAPPDARRPRTRGDCIDGDRPCPWVSCKFHLYLDVLATGSLKLNQPRLDPWELEDTCVLDVAEGGAQTLERVGALMGITRERTRQVELAAARKPEGRVTDRPTRAHEYLFLLAKSEVYHYDAGAILEPVQHPTVLHRSSSKTAAQEAAFFGNAPSNLGRCGTDPAGRNRRSVWFITTEPTPDAHFATFPRKLVEPCILAGCPAGGVVLDPFGGSGTVGRVAEDLGRKWLLFDLNPEYAKIADRKTAQRSLLGLVSTPTEAA